MPNPPARRDETSPAVRPAAPRLTPQTLEEFLDKPLRQLPPDWRLPAWDFWSHWSNLMPNQLTLASRLRHWIDQGLTLDDIRAVFARLMTPEASGQFRYHGELYAELAALVGERLKRRQQLRAMLDRRSDADEPADLSAQEILRRYTESLRPE